MSIPVPMLILFCTLLLLLLLLLRRTTTQPPSKSFGRTFATACSRQSTTTWSHCTPTTTPTERGLDRSQCPRSRASPLSRCKTGKTLRRCDNMAFGIWHLAFGIWCWLGWHLAFGIWYLRGWYLAFAFGLGVWGLKHYTVVAFSSSFYFTTYLHSDRPSDSTHCATHNGCQPIVLCPQFTFKLAFRMNQLESSSLSCSANSNTNNKTTGRTSVHRIRRSH